MKLLLLPLMLLAGCASLGQDLTTQCVHPSQGTVFYYEGFYESELRDNLLVLSNKQAVVYYSIPDGYACATIPTEKTIGYEQEEH